MESKNTKLKIASLDLKMLNAGGLMMFLSIFQWLIAATGKNRFLISSGNWYSSSAVDLAVLRSARKKWQQLPEIFISRQVPADRDQISS